MAAVNTPTETEEDPMYDEPEELTDEEIDTLTDDELAAGEPAPGTPHPRERVRLLHARREARRERNEELAALRAEVAELRAKVSQ